MNDDHSANEDDMPRAFCDILHTNALDYGDHLAIVYGEARLTWLNLDDEISRVSNALVKAFPENHGARVAIILENRPEWLAVLYGAQRAGMIPTPINTRFVGKELRHIFQTSSPVTCVCSPHFINNILDAKSNSDQKFPLIVIGDTMQDNDIISWNDFVKKVQTTPSNVRLSKDDIGVQLYTGGTTGLPKGSNFTHRALIDACTLIPEHGLSLIDEGKVPERALIPPDYDLKFLVPTPLYHLSGFMPAIIMAAMKRSIVFPTSLGFSSSEICHLIESERITAVFMVPTMFRMLLDSPELKQCDFSSVTLFSSGGSKMSASLKKEVLTSFPEAVLVDGYGQTENIGAAIYSFLTVDDIPKIVDGYIGKPISGVSMRIVNEDGEDVAPGEVGEAIYRSPSLMKGYHGEKELTEDSFHGDWFRTGDLFLKDDEGQFYYVERKSEVIFTGAEKVFPGEVEEIICSHPKVQSVVVVGEPDRTWGEVVKAYVVPLPGVSITPQDVIDWCDGKIATYKKPKIVEIKDTLPESEDGKILRSALKNED
jgi:acyl-CoA synthetase (AMP-forming)/AMP-acid ligase II